MSSIFTFACSSNSSMFLTVSVTAYLYIAFPSIFIFSLVLYVNISPFLPSLCILEKYSLSFSVLLIIVAPAPSDSIIFVFMSLSSVHSDNTSTPTIKAFSTFFASIYNFAMSNALTNPAQPAKISKQIHFSMLSFSCI